MITKSNREPTLLWTNPSIAASSGFPAQTISVNYSQYKWLIVIVMGYQAQGGYIAVPVHIDSVLSLPQAAGDGMAAGYWGCMMTSWKRARMIGLITTKDSIAFSTGADGETWGKPGACIPCYIYGM